MSIFEKRFVDGAAAAEAARRSAALRAQGLPTPAARAGGAAVAFERIGGKTGLALLEMEPAQWLRPLAHLHRCAVADLTAFDPLRRIRPRLPMLTSPAIRHALDRLAGALPGGGVLLHGDFHPGQLIADAGGQVWLIDLDDLCLGPPEADLGNLLANLATQDGLEGTPQTRLEHWRDRLCDAWQGLAGPLDEESLDRHLAVALIRRHLKLREARRRDFESEIAALVTRAACRISPSGSAAYRG